ncbi:YdcF family protein [Thioalbus denitrificans]|uniref:Uncharacterized SAM-binding protein YcdF (DUF218 family) n=1 Tax=Thioalbus denitrificans TaxID=547122 RepID=A0A369CFA2_9GAMM|nr:YdcF family protein [Thioalbus denitrificans]RCX32231.1 uncharacterized SAM-binding protein YcdF (DUF218 family) [Thioalbus denitrificans]
MELYLTKILSVFAFPLGAALLLGLLTLLLLLLRRGQALPFFILLLAVGGLWPLSTPYLADRLLGSLEWRNPPAAVESLPQADAIVILGGALEGVQPPRLVPDLGEAADRVLHAARLYRAGKAPRIVVSGGNLPWDASVASEAEAIRGLLMEWGVPETAVLIEPGSRTTRENAILTRELLEREGLDRVLLVTSAFHMPRALGAFRAVGIEAVPSATDYRASQASSATLLDYLPDAKSLYRSSVAVKEYLGYRYYRLRGWIAATPG